MGNELANCPKCNSKKTWSIYPDYITFDCETTSIDDSKNIDQSFECIIACRDSKIKELESKIFDLESKYLSFASKEGLIPKVDVAKERDENLVEFLKDSTRKCPKHWSKTCGCKYD